MRSFLLRASAIFAIVSLVVGSTFGSSTHEVHATASSTPEAVIDLDASAMAILEASDGSIYLGGGFLDVDGLATEGLAKLNADGTVDTDWQFVTDFGVIYTLAEATDGKIYVGGTFSTIGGVARENLARINTDGTVDVTFQADTNNTVRDIEVDSGGNVYIAGLFTTVDGATNRGVAKINSAGVVQWSLSTFTSTLGDGSAYALELDSSDNSVVFGGSFNNVNGTTATGLAKLNSSGTVQSYPDVTAASYAVNALAMAADGSVYVGGYFTSIEGVAHQSLARVTTADVVDETWQADLNDDSVHVLALDTDGNLYVGGNFETLDGVARVSLGFVSSAGVVDADWDPAPDSPPEALTLLDDGTLYVGGSFTTIGGLAIPYIVQFADGGVAVPASNNNDVFYNLFPRHYVDADLSDSDGLLVSGQPIRVKWFGYGLTQYVNIHITIDEGKTWIPIATNVEFWKPDLPWMVPEVTQPIHGARIRVQLTDGIVPTEYGLTRPFSIEPVSTVE